MAIKRKAGWLDHLSYEESILVLKTLALRHSRRAGRFSDSLTQLIIDEDWANLLEFEVNYGEDDDVESLVHARQALAFFQKFEPLVIKGVVKELNAFRKFAETEVTCRLVNDRFYAYRLGTPMGYPWDAILHSARRKIGRILGKCPSLSDLQFSFGPGATVATKKSEACFRTKLGAPIQCSNELVDYAPRLLAEMPPYTLLHAEAEPDSNGYVEVPIEVTPGRLEFVPKDAKKFRTITVEPGLNTLFQQGIGKYIRKRLSRAGVNLQDQGVNRKLAQLASQTNHLATIDFSSASDTISKGLVQFLLPDDWSLMLSVARTGTVAFEGLPIQLEKFSTMGNSFTFELESLIFYAIGWAILRHRDLPTDELSIFGDDLVIRSDAYHLATCVFAFCGFTISPTKSFWQGPFRESCGGDYFKGIDIRPFYQKKLISGETLFTLHNFYMRNGDLDEAAFVRDVLIHPDLVIFGPDGYGDGHLIGAWVNSKSRVRLAGARSKRFLIRDLGWEGDFFETYRHQGRQIRTAHHGDTVLPSYSIYKRDPQPLEEPSAQHSAKQGYWCDAKYFTVPGTKGYEKVSIYTLRRGIFTP